MKWVGLGLDWTGLDWIDCTCCTVRGAMQAIPHSPARPNVASHMGGPSDLDLDDPMQAGQNQVVRRALGVGMDISHWHGTCTFTHMRMHLQLHTSWRKTRSKQRTGGESRRPLAHPGRIGSDQRSSDQLRSRTSWTHWPAVPSDLCRWPGPVAPVVALHLQEGRQSGAPERGPRGEVWQRMGRPEAVCSGSGSRF